ncbi:alpha-tocopherol transfer protein-like [Argiope bruennichi]|uniref:Alpha-tocopherol transfer protein like n=1 Tax=Argiope bruennichi TaxID=94029 RepID=A0A8T0EVF5_ARGBR|nr:alpha-tocopherol transfer protein-like [Argiope bruennichi]KAF8778366.1 Alpha-tocopherol transfer protein like [Argiope bruennichi]
MDLRPAWMKGLAPEMVLVAETELGETPEKRAEALEELKLLIKEERSKGFCPLQDDEFLIRFLRARKYDVGKAFTTLKNYYMFKSEYSGVITDLTPRDLKRVLELEHVFVSPKRAPDGEGLLIVFIGSLDFDACTLDEVFAASFIGAEIGLETDASQVCGCRIVLDLQGMSWRKFKHFVKPSFLRCFARCIQDVLPCRVKGIHAVNQPVYFDIAFNTMKPFLSQKITERAHFHGDDYKSLHEHIPPEALPEELGGHLGRKDFQDFRTMMLQNTPLIERLNTYIYNGVQSKQTCRAEQNSNTTTRNLFKVLSV